METAGVSAGAEIDLGFQELLPELFVRCKQGDGDAVNELVRHTQSKMFGIAWSVTRSREDALDVTQETYLRFLDRVGEIRDPAAVMGWLCRTVVNLSIDALRRRKVRVASPLPAADHVAATVTEPDGMRRMESRELGTILLGLADDLSRQQRLAFLLRDVRGLSLPDVAESLECSVGAAKAHLCLARGKLRGWLKTRHPEFLE